MLNNKGKAKLLGMPFGTANNRLKKALLFEFAGRLGLTKCYRCDAKIINIDDFSVEHKEAWGSAKDPVQMFFDLDNIAFSHMTCNYSAGIRPAKKYASRKEKYAASQKRWYARNKEHHLAYKRKVYAETH